eukprot:3698086-Rhodomonas_salina.1
MVRTSLALATPTPPTIEVTKVIAQIQSGQGEVIITNDGATILKQMSVAHPTAKMVSPCPSSRASCRQLTLLRGR